MSTPSVSRRKFLRSTGASLVSSVAASAAATSGPEREAGKPVRRPNLILFTPEETRADCLACFGNPVVKTPNFDRLAASGTRFSNCQVQFPVCGASRSSLLTGWPTSVHGHRSLYYFLRHDEPNLFKYLKSQGYDVYWYGLNTALAPASFPVSVTEWNYYGVEGAGIPPDNRSNSTPPWPRESPYYYSFLYKEGMDRRKYSDYANVQAAIRILERREPERPFCIFLPLGFAHVPYCAPQGFHNLYNPDDLPPLRPIGLPSKPNFHEGIRKSYNLGGLTEHDFRKIRAVYLGMVSYSDWLMGELLEAVEKAGHEDDTAIFLLSDHADYAGDYGLVEKWPSGMEDCLTHVPLIARLPGGVQNHVVNEMTELYDVMATCLELAGIKAQHTHFARSLIPQLRGAAGDPDRASFTEGGYNTYEPQCFEPPMAPEHVYYPKTHLQLTQPAMVTRTCMVRTQDHKLVVRPLGLCEFYDYRQDPQELHNLFGEASAAAAQAQLERRLLYWYASTTGIAPFEKDFAGAPPFFPTPSFHQEDWQRKMLDQGILEP